MLNSSQDSDTPASAPAASQPDHYEAMHSGFRWQVDEFFNIAQACCSRWAGIEEGSTSAAESVAIRVHQADGKTVFHT